MEMIQKIGSLVLSFPIGLGRGTIILFSSLHSVIKIIIGHYTPDVRTVILQILTRSSILIPINLGHPEGKLEL